MSHRTEKQRQFRKPYLPLLRNIRTLLDKDWTSEEFEEALIAVAKAKAALKTIAADKDHRGESNALHGGIQRLTRALTHKIKDFKEAGDLDETVRFAGDPSRAAAVDVLRERVVRTSHAGGPDKLADTVLADTVLAETILADLTTPQSPGSTVSASLSGALSFGDVSPIGSPIMSEEDDQVSMLRDQVSALKQRLREKKTEYEDITTHVVALQIDVDAEKKQKEELQVKVDALQSEVHSGAATAQGLRQKLARARGTATLREEERDELEKKRQSLQQETNALEATIKDMRRHAAMREVEIDDIHAVMQESKDASEASVDGVLRELLNERSDKAALVAENVQLTNRLTSTEAQHKAQLESLAEAMQREKARMAITLDVFKRDDALQKARHNMRRVKREAGRRARRAVDFPPDDAAAEAAKTDELVGAAKAAVDAAAEELADAARTAEETLTPDSGFTVRL